MNTILKLLLPLSIALPVACTQPENGSATYNRSEVQSAQRTIKAQIVSKRAVKIKGGTGIGTSTGAATGYIAGSTVGGSANDNAVGAIAGAVIGATIGTAIENSALEVDATEYIIENDVTGLLTIIMTDSSFVEGSNVYVSLGSPPTIIGVARN